MDTATSMTMPCRYTAQNSRRRRGALAGGFTRSRALVREQVARAADGLQQPLRVRAQLLPQPGDVDVDGAVKRFLRAALGQLHQLLAGEHAAGAFGERLEERKLVARQRKLAAGQRGAV